GAPRSTVLVPQGLLLRLVPLRAHPWRAPVGAVGAPGGILHPAPIEQVRDREQLQAGVALAPAGRVDPGGRRLDAHRPGGLVQADQDADPGLLALDDAPEIPHASDVHLTGLDRGADLAGCRAVL